MKRAVALEIIVICAFFVLILEAQENRPLRSPASFALYCPGGDCPLLKGAPQTNGMRGGSVKLKPGESVGWHSTNQSEEALVILHGSGIASVEGGSSIPLNEKILAYIPPGTRHNVSNNGGEILEYVWIVAPVTAH